MIKIGNNLSEWSAYSCQPKTKKELEQIIEDRISKEGPNCDLNDIDISQITDMSYLFYGSKFDGDISRWDVSNVINMTGMFDRSRFNQDISKWDVNKVKKMDFMFCFSKFNQDISKWKIDKDCNTDDVIKTIYFIKNHFKSKTVNFASFAHISMHKF